MIEGGGSKTHEACKVRQSTNQIRIRSQTPLAFVQTWLYQHPDESKQVLQKVCWSRLSNDSMHVLMPVAHRSQLSQSTISLAK
jgi:hypothetical protein